MSSTNFYTIEIKQPAETNPEKNLDFMKTLESALLSSLLEKQFIHQQQFDLCIQRIRNRNTEETKNLVKI